MSGKVRLSQLWEVNNLDALANILHCKVGNLPMKYLGMPLGTSFEDSFNLESYFGENGEETICVEAPLFI